ncbi:MAG: glycosyltransferase family 4 protein, partial [Gemmata sp.]
MHVAQFVQRFPPALGGSEAYTARLCEYLTNRGDAVSVWTSEAIDLSEMWGRARTPPPPDVPPEPYREKGTSRAGRAPGLSASDSPSPTGMRFGLRRYAPLYFPGRRYVLKALSLLPVRRWQCLTTPCNPVCPRMWHDAGAYVGPLDAVHATAFPYSFPIMCALRLARRRKVPFLLTPFLHLGDPTDTHDRTRRQYTGPHLRWLLRQADRVFVQTRAERDTVCALGLSEERVVLQGLGVDFAECTGGDRPSFRAACSLSSQEMVFGHLANNSAEKGTVDLLRAAERAWAKGAKFRVALAGPDMPSFQAFWQSFGAKDRVARLGVLSAAQKRDFFAGIDAFVLPSRCDSFGLVLLEAWANGKPNVVYRAGGPAELVRHEVDGLQAACGDANELAAHMTRLAADAGLRAALGQSGRSRAANEFRWPDKLEQVRRTMRG